MLIFADVLAQKFMTIQFFIHSIVKRAEFITLLDSRATENFINLSYAKWLHLPIKQLPKAQSLLNVDGTKNKSGERAKPQCKAPKSLRLDLSNSGCDGILSGTHYSKLCCICNEGAGLRA